MPMQDKELDLLSLTMVKCFSSIYIYYLLLIYKYTCFFDFQLMNCVFMYLFGQMKPNED